MNKFIHKLGVPKDWSVVDVVGLDDELLATVPSPVLAVLLLYPSGNQHETLGTEEKASGQSHSDQVYFLQQTIRNACGTVALLNSISAIHEMSAREGQTQFIYFIFNICTDGRKSFPINHGPTSRENLLKDAATVCRKFIERDPENVRFNVLALAAAAN
ncbi:ubiquitin carboxyl-terminal hydrolase isozyme L3-like [Limulus polyphemus]|uniref:Ubiquitin carboxyl-terminal hydrolase n=1 Tax=Limulus polyphemus TaxID=6850 RepID=A0ABM1STH4_LIMPO|nr:ubiquitin carboxyl-terminal hydrolase isozyme L3-like [Limulus polyphemus]